MANLNHGEYTMLSTVAAGGAEFTRSYRSLVGKGLVSVDGNDIMALTQEGDAVYANMKASEMVEEEYHLHVFEGEKDHGKWVIAATSIDNALDKIGEKIGVAGSDLLADRI